MNTFEGIAESLRKSTVKIHDAGQGVGSGVVWRSGTVVTNAHVVRTRRITVEAWDGSLYEASVKRWDPQRDLAELRVNCPLLPAVHNRTELLRVGELVLALGNPFGVAGAVASGIIHSLDRDDWIQADIRLAPGNSGGPLADSQGRVIGINSMIAHGLGLALPTAAVERFLSAELA